MPFAGEYPSVDRGGTAKDRMDATERNQIIGARAIMCDHKLNNAISAIHYCKPCDVVYCRKCGKEWGEGFEVEWMDGNPDDAINFTCGCKEM